MDDFECLRAERRKFFKGYLKKRTPEQRRRLLASMYNEVDSRSGEFTKRDFFEFAPTTFSGDELREHKGPKRRDRPALSDELYEFYSDGVRSDSDEGRARSRRNGERTREILLAIANRQPGEKVAVGAWDFSEGCPKAETGPQDVQDGPEEDFDFDVDRDTDPAAIPF